MILQNDYITYYVIWSHIYWVLLKFIYIIRGPIVGLFKSLGMVFGWLTFQSKKIMGKKKKS